MRQMFLNKFTLNDSKSPQNSSPPKKVITRHQLKKQTNDEYWEKDFPPISLYYDLYIAIFVMVVEFKYVTIFRFWFAKKQFFW